MYLNDLKTRVEHLLALGDVRIGGDRPWDISVHNERFYSRVLGQGSMGLGESYMDGWWDCPQLDEMFSRMFRADGKHAMQSAWQDAITNFRATLLNLQTRTRSVPNVREHYDLGNELYFDMLDHRLVYSCGNWERAGSLDEAQEAKLDFVCRKLGLTARQRILDIGCGWGSFGKFAAEKYGAAVVGITLSKEQAEFGREKCADLPVEIRLQDYREVDEQFDHIVSLGMFEHVGYKNYRTYMRVVRRCLKEGGRFFLESIGSNQSQHATDPWIDKYIFPGSMLPSIKQVGKAMEGLFIAEELHNWGPYYDRTLMVWFRNFQEHWNELQARYGQRFYRMWKYYLLLSAGLFRSRAIQDWEILLTPCDL